VSLRECLKVFAICIECPTELERRGGSFIAPQENLVIGVLETRTCLLWRPNMSGQPLWNSAWGPDISGPGLSRYEIGLGQTCPGLGPNMSGKCR
jgi:hypothetical protein